MGKQEAPTDREMHYIIQPAPGSLPHACKELTQAVHIQQRSLEKKLQSCLEELRQICMHEAELTGVLPKEFPLKPGECPPKVRRRVGALFKLDDRTIHCCGEDPVGCLERDLALQRQITEAARRLYLEDSLSRKVRHQRKAALKAAEQKLISLEERLSHERSLESLQLEDSSSVSESSSVSDVTNLEKDDNLSRVQSYTSANRPLPPGASEGLRPLGSESDNDKSPLQNSPWTESCLDLPYEKNQRRLSNTHSHSRVQSFQEPSEIRDRTLRRRATSFNPSSPVYTLSLSNPVYISSNPLSSSLSSDSVSESSALQHSYNLAYCPVDPAAEVLMVARTPSLREHSLPCGSPKSDVTEELRCWHVRAQMKVGDAQRPRFLDRKGAVRLHSGTVRSHLGRSQTQRAQISPRHVLRRTAEGAPLQWYDPEEAQIISQV